MTPSFRVLELGPRKALDAQYGPSANLKSPARNARCRYSIILLPVTMVDKFLAPT